MADLRAEALSLLSAAREERARLIPSGVSGEAKSLALSKSGGGIHARTGLSSLKDASSRAAIFDPSPSALPAASRTLATRVPRVDFPEMPGEGGAFMQQAYRSWRRCVPRARALCHIQTDTLPTFGPRLYPCFPPRVKSARA